MQIWNTVGRIAASSNTWTRVINNPLEEVNEAYHERNRSGVPSEHKMEETAPRSPQQEKNERTVYRLFFSSPKK